MTPLLQAQLVAAIVIGAAATVEDIRTRTVPTTTPWPHSPLALHSTRSTPGGAAL
jgi:hypothetical protein